MKAIHIMIATAASGLFLASSALADHHKQSGMKTDFTMSDFASFDTDGSGVLTPKEMKAMSAAQRKAVLAMDANGNGRVSKPEASDWVDKGARMADPAGRSGYMQQADPASRY